MQSSFPLLNSQSSTEVPHLLKNDRRVGLIVVRKAQEDGPQNKTSNASLARQKHSRGFWKRRQAEEGTNVRSRNSHSGSYGAVAVQNWDTKAFFFSLPFRLFCLYFLAGKVAFMGTLWGSKRSSNYKDGKWESYKRMSNVLNKFLEMWLASA